jgi:hypothetical protein
MSGNWITEMTDVLLDQLDQDMGREKAMQDEMKLIKNKQQRIDLGKKLPNINSGQLMCNG